jgi:hypothetical protein
MDHSYSTERERLQKSDHSYFTVAKKTPQVVLRKAQQLKEQLQETTKSAVCQDHSYVRATDLISHPVDDVDIEHANLLLDLFHYHEQLHQLPPSVTMEIPYSDCSDDEYLRPAQSPGATSVATAQTMTIPQQQSDLDDLRCWISLIQLDHAYDGPGLSSMTGCDIGSADCDAGNGVSPVHRTDHAYDRQGFDVLENNSTGVAVVDHTYDYRDSSGASDDESTSSQEACDRYEVVGGRCERLSDHAYDYRLPVGIADRLPNTDDDVTGSQHWDHAYNVRCGIEESYFIHDETSRSGCLRHLDHSYGGTLLSGGGLDNFSPLLQNWDHAYVGWTCSDVSSVGTRRSVSTSRWSSSDDVRAANRMAEQSRLEPVSVSLHQLI